MEILEILKEVGGTKHSLFVMSGIAIIADK